MTDSAGLYTDADRARCARIEEQFRAIHEEEVRRAANSGRLRTAVRKIDSPHPQL